MSEELKRGIPKGKVIGDKIIFTEEEKIKHDNDFDKVLKEFGFLG